ncbi:MAG: hypothetical protein ACKO26_07540 [Planctomycetota bacterium]
MGHSTCRLGQEKACVRRIGHDSPATAFLHQGVEVKFGVESKKTKLETVLAAGFPVATAAIATELGEDWHYLVWEIDRQNLIATGGFHGYCRLGAGKGNRETPLSIGHGNRPTQGSHFDRGGKVTGVLAVSCDINLLPVFEDSRDNELCRVIKAFEDDFGRKNLQAGDFAGLGQWRLCGWSSGRFCRFRGRRQCGNQRKNGKNPKRHGSISLTSKRGEVFHCNTVAYSFLP